MECCGIKVIGFYIRDYSFYGNWFLFCEKWRYLYIMRFGVEIVMGIRLVFFMVKFERKLEGKGDCREKDRVG